MRRMVTAINDYWIKSWAWLDLILVCLHRYWCCRNARDLISAISSRMEQNTADSWTCFGPVFIAMAIHCQTGYLGPLAVRRIISMNDSWIKTWRFMQCKIMRQSPWYYNNCILYEIWSPKLVMSYGPILATSSKNTAVLSAQWHPKQDIHWLVSYSSS